MCTASAAPAEMSTTAAVSTSAEMSAAAAATSPATMASTSAMTSASASAAAFCVSSACKNGGQEDNGTEFEFWHGNLERVSASYR